MGDEDIKFPKSMEPKQQLEIADRILDSFTTHMVLPDSMSIDLDDKEAILWFPEAVDGNIVIKIINHYLWNADEFVLMRT